MLWSRRLGDHPAAVWLRQQVLAAAETLKSTNFGQSAIG
jgi:hypothetical protein